jgi:hypothetical protein
MTTSQERWALFVDFAATIQELLTDAQNEMVEAMLINPITPFILDQLSQIWRKLTVGFEAFTHASIAIQNDRELTPEQVVMATELIANVNKIARRTDASLRLFFQTSGLASELPSRQESQEGYRIQ